PPFLLGQTCFSHAGRQDGCRCDRRAVLRGASETLRAGATPEGALASRAAGAAGAPAVSFPGMRRRAARRNGIGQAEGLLPRLLACSSGSATAAPGVSRAAPSGRASMPLRSTVGTAAVARPATRRIVLSEVSPQEHASAFRGLGVVGHEPKTPLALVAKCLELRHEIADAGCEALRRDDDGDAAAVISLDEPRLLEVRQQHLADARRHACREGERVSGRGALLGRPGDQRVLEPLQMPDAGAAQSLKPLLDLHIGRVEQQYAVRRVAVAAGAPDLLHVLLQRPW